MSGPGWLTRSECAAGSGETVLLTAIAGVDTTAVAILLTDTIAFHAIGSSR